jgi:hypothetical protein
MGMRSKERGKRSGREWRHRAQEAHLLIGMRARYDLITLAGSVGLRIARRDFLSIKRKTQPPVEGGR